LRDAFDARDHAALRDLAALLRQHFRHRTRGRRRNVHRRLVGFERDERRVDVDFVADLDEHVDDGDVGEIAEVRNHEIDPAHDIAPTRSAGLASVSAKYFAMRAPKAPSMTR
jgi:hypothetical protein